MACQRGQVLESGLLHWIGELALPIYAVHWVRLLLMY
jgi:peptidoglycan/LPS O-acetylase OafA/YrhL